MNLSKEELSFIKERYTDVDVDNLLLPALGMYSVTSLELLKASIKYDLEYKNFEDCLDPLEALNICKSINDKIEKWRKA